ncbi:TPA: restriction endonuclease subunit S [Vibrio parahaemolyticus]|nr:restriction endonuclease subunit S [Vibrio parahaemolyticus]HCG5277854.1 restriction endonuclease subunit S [Vibrio parahaemolyticus]
MTGRYKAYPEYKDSGIDWFGNIPSHWRVAGFKKHIASIVDYRGKTPVKTDDGVLLVTARNIKNGKLDYSLSQEYIAPDDYDDVMSRGKPEIGHVLFTTEAPLGEVANIDRVDFALAQRVIKFDGLYNDLNNYYFKYLIMSEEFQQSLNLFASGSTVKGIKAERFVYLRNLLPSYEEQQKIANFLDHETAKIDTLITKQEKLIELLKEKRQAVISHAVTKGLNPDAPMKDSGVEWLGEVPEHWSVIRLRFLCDITTGSRDTQDAKENGQYPFFVRSEKVQSIDTYSFEGEGVMTSGDGAGVGKIYHHFIGKCEIHQRVYLFHNFKHITPRYFYYFLKQNLEPVALAQSAKSTVDSLRLPILQEFRMCFGDESEQKVICEYVDSLSEKYDGLIDGANKAIELMKERKIALISAAVTGKIDVRDWQESA